MCAKEEEAIGMFNRSTIDRGKDFQQRPYNSYSSENGMLEKKRPGGQDLANPDSGIVSTSCWAKVFNLSV